MIPTVRSRNPFQPMYPYRDNIPFTRWGLRLYNIWIHDSGPATCGYLHIAGEHTVCLESVSAVVIREKIQKNLPSLDGAHRIRAGFFRVCKKHLRCLVLLRPKCLTISLGPSSPACQAAPAGTTSSSYGTSYTASAAQSPSLTQYRAAPPTAPAPTAPAPVPWNTPPVPSTPAPTPSASTAAAAIAAQRMAQLANMQSVSSTPSSAAPQPTAAEIAMRMAKQREEKARGVQMSLVSLLYP